MTKVTKPVNSRARNKASRLPTEFYISLLMKPLFFLMDSPPLNRLEFLLKLSYLSVLILKRGRSMEAEIHKNVLKNLDSYRTTYTKESACKNDFS